MNQFGIRSFIKQEIEEYEEFCGSFYYGYNISIEYCRFRNSRTLLCMGSRPLDHSLFCIWKSEKKIASKIGAQQCCWADTRKFSKWCKVQYIVILIDGLSYLIHDHFIQTQSELLNKLLNSRRQSKRKLEKGSSPFLQIMVEKISTTNLQSYATKRKQYISYTFIFTATTEYLVERMNRIISEIRRCILSYMQVGGK